MYSMYFLVDNLITMVFPRLCAGISTIVFKIKYYKKLGKLRKFYRNLNTVCLNWFVSIFGYLSVKQTS